MAASSDALTIALGFTVGEGDRTVLIKPEGGSVAISTRGSGKALIPRDQLPEVIRRLQALVPKRDPPGR